ncbi:MAG TPA: catalase [Lachnospiraceae bacterium]|nr:catalase [Lachnospiraceae bacterium]
MTNAAGHLKTVVTHKYLVARGCFAVGLYRQGILHDLSKFSPTEFMVGARYWQGNRSPNNAERETIGYSSSWLHHKGRNRHHYEYWVDYNLRGEIDGQVLIPVKMPGRYVVEMLMDRIAASKVYKGDAYTDASALEYYRGGRPELLMHPETAALLERLLTMLAEKGEKETFAYVRAHLRKGGLFDR